MYICHLPEKSDGENGGQMKASRQDFSNGALNAKSCEGRNLIRGIRSRGRHSVATGQEVN